MTTETQKIMLRNQRSGGRRIVAPDIQQRNLVRKQAESSEKAGNNAQITGKKIGIGTDAVYSTLPNSATVATTSQLFSVFINPA